MVFGLVITTKRRDQKRRREMKFFVTLSFKGALAFHRILSG